MIHTCNELAKRAISCDNWLWEMEGIEVVDSHHVYGRIVAINLGGGFCVANRAGNTWFDSDGSKTFGLLPNLEDFATLGCLLEMVRRAWDDPHMYMEKCDTGWGPRPGDWDQVTHRIFGFNAIPSEREALVVTLEASTSR